MWYKFSERDEPGGIYASLLVSVKVSCDSSSSFSESVPDSNEGRGDGV